MRTYATILFFAAVLTVFPAQAGSDDAAKLEVCRQAAAYSIDYWDMDKQAVDEFCKSHLDELDLMGWECVQETLKDTRAEVTEPVKAWQNTMKMKDAVGWCRAQ